MIRIGILVSGSGTNLQSIIEACADGRIDAHIAVVISNRPEAYALKRADLAGLATRVVLAGDHPSRESYDAAVVEILKQQQVELVVLAGYMRIVTPLFLKAFPNRVMNIHPALLPAFPGLNVQQKAIDYGVRFSGCTVHFLDEGVDTGPIISQAVCPVYPDDTAEELEQRILKLEHRIYPEAIALFAAGRLRIEGRRVTVVDAPRQAEDCLFNPILPRD
ncbi:MAG: Phosphoribosylglycinamide formyltransferase [Deltaproteobacteria bacterium ADurb.Bin510]|nr:MAG: Phosphoribosylglycinamide formyltransferase [Deltaproteobacteria bacterium ADurb.Bin510]